MMLQVIKISIMIFQSLVGDNKMELNIGLLEIHGEAIGDKTETSD